MTNTETNTQPRSFPFAARRLLAAWFLSGAILTASALQASAQVQCGDIIEGKTTVVLQNDIAFCTPATGGITVVGPATLDLNGAVVFCSQSVPFAQRPAGITLTGKGATVRNGAVGFCGQGVLATGAGSHHIEGIFASLNGTGFRLLSDQNHLTNNLTHESDLVGFFIDGLHNKVKRNHSVDRDHFGFVIGGTKNTVSENAVTGASGPGFDVIGDHNTLLKNTATDTFRGFTISGGAGNKLKQNTAIASETEGFFLLNTENNSLQKNRAEDSGSSGILVKESAQNTLTKNTALNNNRKQQTFFDLEDSAADCGTNQWSRNTFVTSNRACID